MKNDKCFKEPVSFLFLTTDIHFPYIILKNISDLYAFFFSFHFAFAGHFTAYFYWNWKWLLWNVYFDWKKKLIGLKSDKKVDLLLWNVGLILAKMHEFEIFHSNLLSCPGQAMAYDMQSWVLNTCYEHIVSLFEVSKFHKPNII